MQSDSSSEFLDFAEDYWDIAFGIFFGILAYILHLNHYDVLSAVVSALSIVALSVTVSEVAEILAERLGEPYGSFVLTFSAVAVEIILLFMILTADNNTRALETVKSGIISAVIVDMNVLLGLAVFIGGLAFAEQEHNEDTSSTYTTILFISSIALLVPSLLVYTPHGEQKLLKASIIISIMLFTYYLIIYVFQTKTHSHFFKSTARSRILRLKKRKKIQENEEHEDDYIFEKFPNWANLIVIFSLIFAVGIMAEIFAHDSAHVFQSLGINAGLAGLIIAIISVSPELITAIKAAKNDQIQRVVNIAMGASTVSILLTVPILMGLAYVKGIPFTLNFNALQIGALLLTVILAWKTTDNGETNYIEGVSHLMFFACFAVIAAMY
ncbi:MULTISPECIES: calcium:proton antiporter [unclassified Nitratiruptor]|uniref:calcium:proton antiporter n=1 Tax=unclassified Nitratiruptor TaxID=2624044 RepID=UPI001915DF5E|nr:MULTISPECIES: sodium:proton exchanger [unclassified Nitratiruptor]BCD60487.1 Ca2+:H+ antiporter [Nitratiruptor sp. YY08-10]BCD64024.1 Ca2+:H+ antiporter [Nitratiruptor sp. YY08-14]